MTDPFMLVNEIRKLEQRQRQLGEEANRALEAISSIPEDVMIGHGTNLKEEITRLNSQGCSIESLEKKLEDVQKSIDVLRIMEQEIENKPPEDNEIAPSGSHRSPCLFKTPRKADDRQVPSREGNPSTRRTKSVDVKKMERMFKDATEENVRSIIAYVTELKERIANLQYQKQLLVCQVLELEEAKEAGNNEADSCLQSPMACT
ncbi:hypothetical protein V6N13_044708 [Hibiscus sabdariffa]